MSAYYDRPRDERVQASAAASTDHIWRSGIQKCKCGWKPTRDGNIAVEINVHRQSAALAAADVLLSNDAAVERVARVLYGKACRGSLEGAYHGVQIIYRDRARDVLDALLNGDGS